MSDREVGFLFLAVVVIAIGYLVFTMSNCEYTDTLERGPKGGFQQMCVVNPK